VRYEVNSIGATGAKPPLRGKTDICIGTTKMRPTQSEFITGSDYADLPSSLPWPFEIATTGEGKSKGKKFSRNLPGGDDLRVDGKGGVPRQRCIIRIYLMWAGGLSKRLAPTQE